MAYPARGTASQYKNAQLIVDLRRQLIELRQEMKLISRVVKQVQQLAEQNANAVRSTTSLLTTILRLLQSVLPENTLVDRLIGIMQTGSAFGILGAALGGGPWGMIIGTAIGFIWGGIEAVLGD